MLSLIGIALLIIGSFFTSSSGSNITSSDRLIVGSAFFASCLLGLSMALRPNWLKGLLSGEKEEPKDEVHTSVIRIRSGHHPDCQGFASHKIKTKNKTYCAGCLGLAFGAVTGIILLFVYLFMPDVVNLMSSFSMIITGLIFIGFNFLVVAARNKNSFMHLISNVILVAGFFFMVVGMFQYTKSVSYGILAVIISFLLLDTRIQLSHWHHERTCVLCKDSCKVYGA
jgi:hypothetical protein